MLVSNCRKVDALSPEVSFEILDLSSSDQGEDWKQLLFKVFVDEMIHSQKTACVCVCMCVQRELWVWQCLHSMTSPV